MRWSRTLTWRSIVLSLIFLPTAVGRNALRCFHLCEGLALTNCFTQSIHLPIFHNWQLNSMFFTNHYLLWCGANHIITWTNDSIQSVLIDRFLPPKQNTHTTKNTIAFIIFICIHSMYVTKLLVLERSSLPLRFYAFHSSFERTALTMLIVQQLRPE